MVVLVVHAVWLISHNAARLARPWGLCVYANKKTRSDACVRSPASSPRVLLVASIDLDLPR